jgi:Zinc knuckle
MISKFPSDISHDYTEELRRQRNLVEDSTNTVPPTPIVYANFKLNLLRVWRKTIQPVLKAVQEKKSKSDRGRRDYAQALAMNEEKDKKKPYLRGKLSKKGWKKTNTRCHNCGKVGQMAKNCNAQQKKAYADEKNEEWMKKITCFNCGKPGHFAKDCSLPTRREKNSHFVGATMTENVPKKGYNSQGYDTDFDVEPSEKFATEKEQNTYANDETETSFSPEDDTQLSGDKQADDSSIDMFCGSSEKEEDEESMNMYGVHPSPVYCCDDGQGDASEALAESGGEQYFFPDDQPMQAIEEDSYGDTPLSCRVKAVLRILKITGHPKEEEEESKESSEAEEDTAAYVNEQEDKLYTVALQPEDYQPVPSAYFWPGIPDHYSEEERIIMLGTLQQYMSIEWEMILPTAQPTYSVSIFKTCWGEKGLTFQTN